MVAFLREEGGTRSVTEGEGGMRDKYSQYKKRQTIVAQAPSVSLTLDSSLSEGALRRVCLYRYKIYTFVFGRTKALPYRFVRGF